MTPALLLSSLRASGVVLTAKGGKLAYDAPSGVLTAALLAELRAHKAELLALLAANDADPMPSPESVQEWFMERLAIICEASELIPDEAHALAVDCTLRHFWEHRAGLVEAFGAGAVNIRSKTG